MPPAYLLGPAVQRTSSVRPFSCSGKVAFDSAVLAQLVATRRWFQEHREPYRCAHCGSWHLGTTRSGPVSIRERAALIRPER